MAKGIVHKNGPAGWAAAVFAALLLNAVMFGLMPGLLSGGAGHDTAPPLQTAVDVFRIKRPDPPMPEKKKPKPRETEKKPEEQKVAQNLVQHKPVSKPRLPFEINARLPAGPGVVPALDLEKFTAENTGIFAIKDLDQAPRPLVQVKPRHPLRAERMGIEGWVRIRFVITEEGRVDQVEVMGAEPEGIFEKAVLSAISLWRFSPPTKDGEPVRALAELTISFNFDDEF